MRRAMAAVLAVLAPACTAFDFSAPTGGAPDASTDAPLDVVTMADAGGADAGPGFLTVTQAARVCTLVFACPRLGEAIEGSLVIPVATPPTPLNFSGCMDWLAGPVDQGRPGLSEQTMILAGIAQATTCDAAYTASPVHPVDAGATCKASSCLDPSTLETCSSTGGAFTTTCGLPLFDSPGACTDTGTAICLTLEQCTAGLSCRGSSTLVDCYAQGAAYTAFDCTLSGRQCVDKSAASCVVPPSLAAPCLPNQAFDGCKGNSVRHCVGTFLGQTELDCAAVGRSCNTINGVARCAATGDQCTPFDQDVNICDESGITVCIGGHKQSFDCSSLSGGDGGAPLTCVSGDATHTAHCG